MSVALASLRDRHAAVANGLQQAATRLAQVIPLSSGLAPARAIAVALDALSRNPELLKCSPTSIVRSVIQAAEIGLEIGSPLGEAFLVPFKGASTMMVGYKGYVRLILGSPRVTAIKGVLVREGDTFEVDEGNNRIVHVLGKGPKSQRGEVTYAYARVWYGPQESQFEVLDREELDAVKNNALQRATGFSPWKSKDHIGEMYRKTPIRKMAKTMDLSNLGRKAVELDALNAMRRGEVPGVEIREGFTSGRADELKDMLREQHEGKPATIDAEFDE